MWRVKKRKANSAYHLIFVQPMGARVSATSRGEYVTKSKPSLSYMSARALWRLIDDKRWLCCRNQWTRFSRPVTALAYLLIWFVVGAQCRFITWRRWCWWRRCDVYLSINRVSKVQKKSLRISWDVCVRLRNSHLISAPPRRAWSVISSVYKRSIVHQKVGEGCVEWVK